MSEVKKNETAMLLMEMRLSSFYCIAWALWLLVLAASLLSEKGISWYLKILFKLPRKKRNQLSYPDKKSVEHNSNNHKISLEGILNRRESMLVHVM